MVPYQVYLRATVLSTLGNVRRRERFRLWDFFDALARDPFQAGDFVEPIGDRPMQAKIVGRFAVTYWVDHPAREVKVVSLRDADSGHKAG